MKYDKDVIEVGIACIVAMIAFVAISWMFGLPLEPQR